MTAATINRLIGGNIVITTGSSEPTAPNGKVLYKTSADGEWLESDADITDGAFYGFDGKYDAVAVIIPSKDTNGNDVTSIGGSAFSDCNSLTIVTIPNSVTSIEDWAIYNCDGLTNVTIPDSVTSIGAYAFNGCSGLTSVTIGSGVTSIGSSAFYGCSSLTSITIPSSVTTFGEEIIKGCDNLHTVNCPGRTCDEVEILAQGGGLDRAPTGEGDYMNYICSDGTNSIVAQYDAGSGMYMWESIPA